MMPNSPLCLFRAEMSPDARCRNKRRLEAAQKHLAACAARRVLRGWAAQSALHRALMSAMQRAARQSTQLQVFHALRTAVWCAVVTAVGTWQQRRTCNGPHVLNSA